MIGAMVDKALARRLPAGLALALVAMALAVLAVAAPAATTGWQSVEFAQARLIAATTGVGQGSAVDLGLHIRLERGWHTYWRTPGMGGLPPRFDWAGSGNLASVSVGFPAPRRFSAFGAETIGYVDEVVLPIRVRLAVAGAPLDVALALDYAVCAEVCVPVSARFDLRVPAGPAAASPFAALIARYAARVPTPGPLPDLAIAAATLGTGPDGPLLEVAATGAALAAPSEVFIEAAEAVAFGQPRMSADGAGARWQMPVFPAGGGAAMLAGPLRITLVAGARAIEQVVPITRAP